MKVLTKQKQKKIERLLKTVYRGLMKSHDVEAWADAVDATAEIAMVIGGIDMMCGIPNGVK